MTTPKVNTIKRDNSRFYVNPETREKVPGVTSVVGMLPKDFLQFWSAKMVAEEAADNLGAAVQIALGPGGKPALVDYLKGAPRRNTAKAAEIGTDAHEIFERLAKGETVGRVHPDLEPFKAHFSEFLQTVQPRFLFMEETVWSDKHLYAGSFDALAEIDGEIVWIDNKTTRSGIHAEVGIQLAAYRYADYLLRPDGSRIPMPKADGAAVMHVRPEGWKLVPVRADEALFDVFLHLREVFRWEKELKNTVIGNEAYSGPADATVTGPTMRKPRAPRATRAKATEPTIAEQAEALTEFPGQDTSKPSSIRSADA